MKSKTSKNDESSSSVILGGMMYELCNEPSHGVVRAMKKMQKEITINLIKKYRNKFTSDTKIEEALQQIFDNDPQEIANFQDANEEFIVVGTISLATNKTWTFDSLGACSDKEVSSAFEKCKEILGGDITSFL